MSQRRVWIVEWKGTAKFSEWTADLEQPFSLNKANAKRCLLAQREADKRDGIGFRYRISRYDRKVPA